MIMFRWMRERRQRAHLAEVARMLEAENDQLRDRIARRDEMYCRALALVRALRDVNADLDRRLVGEDES
jgi:hypothetical protein